MRLGHPARRAVLLLALAAALGLARAGGAGPIPLFDVGPAGFVGEAAQGPLDQPVAVSSYADFAAVFGASTAGLANPHLAPSVAGYFANGGQRLWVVRVAGSDDASLVGVDGGPGARTGLQALRDVDSLGAIAIPGAVSPAVQSAMIALGESTADRVAILDPVSPTDPNAVIAQRSGLATANGFGALYFPWVTAAPAGPSLSLPPSGLVAGVWARTAPHLAPAGTTSGAIATATGVSYAVSSTLQSTLNPLGIDAIRDFAGSGVLVFGARTLAGNADWQYVSVRREGIALEKSVRRGTAWCVDEPNDAALWAQLRDDTWNFLHARWQAGWMQGVSADEAFFVLCDATTMTAGDLAAGRTVLLFGFAPIRPAEFLLVRIVHERPPVTAVAPREPALALAAPRPNPARGRTTLAYELPRDGTVTLRVLDLSGRVVRTLARGAREAAGRHERAWDGRDDAGAPVATGVYFARLEADGRVFARRLALVR